MNQNSSVHSKTILLAVLFLVFGFFVGQGIANQSYSNLGASARSSKIVDQSALLGENAEQVDIVDISVLDDGSGNKVATKNKVLLSGGNNGNGNKIFGDLYQSTNGKGWSFISKNNIWGTSNGGISGHTMLYYKGSVYILSGSNGYNSYFWKYDGVNWVQVGMVPSKGSDNGLGAVVYNGKIYVMGGADHNGNVTNEVWTYDGITWKQKLNAPWQGRRYFETIVYQNKIWVIGGDDVNLNYINDVWSYDGTTWTQQGTVPWTNINRSGSQSLSVFDDGSGSKIYAIAGGNTSGVSYNDVWTFDGVSWVQKNNATWPVRGHAASFTLGGKLFIAGGWDNGGDLNDIWSTKDGNSWQLEKASANWAKRLNFATVKVPVSFGSSIPLVFTKLGADEGVYTDSSGNDVGVFNIIFNLKNTSSQDVYLENSCGSSAGGMSVKLQDNQGNYVSPQHMSCMVSWLGSGLASPNQIWLKPGDEFLGTIVYIADPTVNPEQYRAVVDAVNYRTPLTTSTTINANVNPLLMSDYVSI